MPRYPPAAAKDTRRTDSSGAGSEGDARSWTGRSREGSLCRQAMYDSPPIPRRLGRPASPRRRRTSARSAGKVHDGRRQGGTPYPLRSRGVTTAAVRSELIVRPAQATCSARALDPPDLSLAGNLLAHRYSKPFKPFLLPLLATLDHELRPARTVRLNSRVEKDSASAGRRACPPRRHPPARPPVNRRVDGRSGAQRVSAALPGTPARAP